MSEAALVRLDPPYRELVERLLKLFGYKYLHYIDHYRDLNFGWFHAYANKDVASDTFLIWCKDEDGELFFKMADYEVLNCWRETVEKAVKTLRESMVLDDIADA